MQTPISSAQTSLVKYGPMVITPIILLIGLLTGDRTTLIMFLPFFLLTAVTNYFIVEAWVDKEAIFIKQWTRTKKYTFDKLDKIGEYKKGITDITLKTESGERRTFLILNPTETFISTNSSDVYKLLMQLKLNYERTLKDK